MNLPISRFVSIFLFVLILIISLLSQKTVAIKFNDSVRSIITYERTVKDVLISNNYPARVTTSTNKILNVPLMESMVIDIKYDGSIQLLP